MQNKLFTPLKIGGIEIKNRIIMAPMCMYEVKKEDGRPRCFHKLHYATRAIGGVGMIIVEATAVETRGRITKKDLGLWSDEQIEAHAELVKGCAKYGAKMAVQLAHAGRKGTCDGIIAPSEIKFSDDYATPKEMNAQDIASVKQSFVDAAVRAKSAGYEAVEIHAAHGYLINQFLCAGTNKRSDEYGGAFENRIRLLLEILREIKAGANITIGVRISASSWLKCDWDVEESVKLARELEKNGADFIHVSSGGVYAKVDSAPKFTPLYQAGYAKTVKNAVKIPVFAVGLITKASECEALLLGDVCDGVALGRELLRNPYFSFGAMKEFGESEKIENAYKRAY
ncbi:NADH:flavin oxidoreductase/NADH oxidase [Campylobacter concisus]|uniref:NADH:flavin oxidoreductase/NADH oxidase n=1 Tax=Campylobacter concisus TaxID=199 RepID=A0A7S9WRC2_9BACT|nr:NADH:flavin oxidoreductase/NADH oxidase [Campylobacter concisus]QPH90413.1 NADH:flavin oxidoreductase/NADH oxidase [Campylobacter concisus]